MTHVKRMLTSADPQEVRVAIVEGGKVRRISVGS